MYSNKIQTKILVTFPGIGKTTFLGRSKAMNLEVVGLGLESYKELNDKPGFLYDTMSLLRNPQFDYIVIPYDDSIITILKESEIIFTMIYPKRDRLDEILNNYKVIDKEEEFIGEYKDGWNDKIDFCEKEQYKIELGNDEYLSDFIEMWNYIRLS